MDLLKLPRKLSWRRYREDLGGFLLAWGFVAVLMLLLVGVANAQVRVARAAPGAPVSGPPSSGQKAPAWILAPEAADGIPAVDVRMSTRGVHTPVRFSPYETREEWEARAKQLRQQILMAAGLWPTPERTPLNARIYDRLERDGYSIEKAYFESYPGFYCTGNLYRPLGRTGPFPGVWSPHGHWTYGRLEHSEAGSVVARAISLARQGYVVFTPDMVGFNDSFQVSHQFGSPREQLWGINVLGLQLWNSIRGLDFLESLPDVDRTRLLMTGASGGGTQTFLATAVDDRVKAAAPVNMVSAHMQGGSNCENAPNLRLDTFNIETAALAAPRPLLMVSASGDWTRDTPKVEFPAVRSIYRLLGVEDRVTTQQFNADHNYNRDSRQAMYEFFGKWALNDIDAAHFREKGIRPEHPSKMLDFYGRELPKGVTELELVDQRIAESERQLNALKPEDGAGLQKFRDVMGTALRQALAVYLPDPKHVISEETKEGRVLLGRRGIGDRIPAAVWRPRRGKAGGPVVLLLAADGKEAAGKSALAAALLSRGVTVFSIDAFQTGESAAAGKRDTSDRFFTTYNRTDDAERVQDILTAVAYLKSRPEFGAVHLAGTGRAGLWTLLARAMMPAAAVERTVADADQFNGVDDDSYLQRMFIPLLRRAGDFRTATTLIAPASLFLHNTGPGFQAGWARDAYRVAGADAALSLRNPMAGDEDIVDWLVPRR